MISHKHLIQILSYDPGTGIFVWRLPRPKVRVGQRAGYSHHRGYRYIEIEGRAYAEHWLAWLYVHGRWPRKQLDHRNRDRADNRIENLRNATHGQNRANSKSTGRYGVKGVSYHPWLKEKPYEAKIKSKKRVFYLGYFATIEEAHQAYCKEAKRLHGEFFNPS